MKGTRNARVTACIGVRTARVRLALFGEVRASARKAIVLYGIVVPRDTAWVRASVGLVNSWCGA